MTSLGHKLESSEDSTSTMESPPASEGGVAAKKGGDKKKRHGLYVSSEQFAHIATHVCVSP